jgi:hypothetical protein
MRNGRLATVSLACMTLLACGPGDARPLTETVAPKPSGSASATDSSVIVLATPQPLAPGARRGCMDALIEGRLVRDPQSGLALMLSSGMVVQVVWPDGYTARDDGGRPALLDASGAVVAHVGDHLTMGGGGPDPWIVCEGSITVGP